MKTMNKKIFFAAAFMLAFIFVPANSQSLLEKLSKKVRHKAEKKAATVEEKNKDKKMDEQIDKSFNHVEKKYDKKKNNHKEDHNNSHNKAFNEYLDQMTNSNAAVKTEVKYTFNSSVAMDFKTYDQDGELEYEGSMISFYNPDKDYMAYTFVNGDAQLPNNDQIGTFILDYGNNSTIILRDDGSMSGIAYRMGDMINENDVKKISEENPEIKNVETDKDIGKYLKKTGNTKKILGYNCDEYKFDDEEISSEMWITKEIKWRNRDMMKKIYSKSLATPDVEDGFLMESTTVNKKTGEKIVFNVTDINKDAKKIYDLTGYKITNLGSGKVPQEAEEENDTDND